MTVLIVDDDPIIHDTLSRILIRSGIEVDSTTSAMEALTLVDRGYYDFVLLDYLMPKYTGEWFMKHANIPEWTKVILHTAYTNRLVLERMLKLGICGYMQKPVTGKELLHHLNHHTAANERILVSA